MGCVSSQGTVPLDDIVISIFGLDNAGKTCLLRSLAGNFDFDTVSTVGLLQESFMYDDIQLTVFDLGGGANFRSIWTRFFAEIWGFIYVVDASDPTRFEESRTTLEQMLEHEMVKGKPFIVVANKQDKEGAVPASKLKSLMKLGRKVQIFDAVVTNIEDNKCNEGVSKAVSALLGEILKNFESISKKRVVDKQKQEKIEADEKAAREERLKKRREEAERAQAEAAAAQEEQHDDAQ